MLKCQQCWHFNIYEHDTFQAQLRWAWKSLKPRGQFLTFCLIHNSHEITNLSCFSKRSDEMFWKCRLLSISDEARKIKSFLSLCNYKFLTSHVQIINVWFNSRHCPIVHEKIGIQMEWCQLSSQSPLKQTTFREISSYSWKMLADGAHVILNLFGVLCLCMLGNFSCFCCHLLTFYPLTDKVPGYSDQPGLRLSVDTIT